MSARRGMTGGPSGLMAAMLLAVMVGVPRVAGRIAIGLIGAGLFGIAGLTVCGPSAVAQELYMSEAGTTPVNDGCLRCHGMATFGYLDPDTRTVVSLAVDPEQYDSSNHYRMACTSCHRGDYHQLPHVKQTDREMLTCLGCHTGGKKSKFRKAYFDGIAKQFKNSVHHKALPDTFDCFSCHDPHVFEVKGDIIDESVVRSDNSVCLTCHDSPTRFSALTDHALPSLRQVHDWLPNPRLHWRSIRCIECHTPRDTTSNFVNHEILRGGAVERNCVTCHNRNSTLLNRLYKHRAKEERESAGLLGSMLRNEAYIIGMTRSPEMDLFTAFIIGCTVLGLGGHGFLRWRAARRIKR